MLADHIGAVFKPGCYDILRTAGRLSFPLFCFLITEGFFHTSDRKNYGIRLGIFAILSELPFNLAFYGKSIYLESRNVFFTLLIGFLAISLIEKYKKRPNIGGIFAVSAVILAELIRCDYGWYGISLIIAFYCFKNQKILKAISLIILTVLYVALKQSYILDIMLKFDISFLDYIHNYLHLNLLGYLFKYCRQLFACFSVIFICFYSGKKGFIKTKKLKTAFYIFYPAHLLILYILKQF